MRRGWVVLIGLGLFVAGGLGLPAPLAGWLALGAAVGLAFAFLIVIATTHWSAPVGWALAAVLVAGVGGVVLLPAGRLIATAWAGLGGVQFLEPAWLWLLASLPLFFLLARRGLGLADLDAEEKQRLKTILTHLVFPPWGLVELVGFMRGRAARVPALGRRWVGFGLRCLVVVCLALALAEPRLAVPHDRLTVLFVLDRSHSVPEELEEGLTDHRWERVRKFINDTVKLRPAGHERDRVGLIVFGRRPRLELFPTDAPRFNLVDVSSPVDSQHTDIAAALQLALATFPEDSAGRIVLISDGNENRGNALEQALLARRNGVEIDVVPLAAGRRNENEVLVERVETPAVVEQGAPLSIKVWVRSYSSLPVQGTLIVRRLSSTEEVLVEDPPPRVTLRQGLNPFSFQQPLGPEQESYTYEAEFRPEGLVDRGRLVRGLPGDRVQNNRASAHVVARGRRRVLLIEDEPGEHKDLVDRLRQAGQDRFRLEARSANFLDRYQDADRFAAFLSNFDCVLLANVPADRVTPAQQEVLRSNTHDQGSGLVMIGGPKSFGAGGWQKTPVEEALPVDAEIKSLEVEEKAGLVLVMHASEMAEGNLWQKRIAKLAIERLSPRDEVGILHYGWNVAWHFPLQEVGKSRESLLRQVDRLQPGDMPDFDPALQMALNALTEPGRRLARRHVIIISDGDPVQNNKGLLTKLRDAKVTVTTVGVATHGPAEDRHLKAIATATKGRWYFPKRPTELPAIYIRETRLVSKSFVAERLFGPRLLSRAGPTAGLEGPLPPLKGFVRTTPKPGLLAEVPIKTPPEADTDYPVLALWTYGLGKAAAFTSDAGAGTQEGSARRWCERWMGQPLYARFWEQLIDWSLRPTESKTLALTTDYRDGKIRVVVEARNDKGEPDLFLRNLKAEVTPPQSDEASRKRELRFEQRGAGVYEAECDAEDAGSYFLALQATRRRTKDGKEVDERESVRGSVTIPYAPEFADMESNPDLLEQLRQETDGQRYADEDDALAQAARAGTVFRPAPSSSVSLQPVWHWLLLAAAVLLLLDVAVRRIAFERLEVAGPLGRMWATLRGRYTEEAPAPFLERLKGRKAQVSEELATRRFEPPAAVTPPPPVVEAGPRPAAPPPTEPPPVQPKEESTDFAERLLRAKKRVWEEREGDQK